MAIEKLKRQIGMTQEQLEFILELVHENVKQWSTEPSEDHPGHDHYGMVKELEETLHKQRALPEKPAEVGMQYVLPSPDLDKAFGPFATQEEGWKWAETSGLYDLDVTTSGMHQLISPEEFEDFKREFDGEA